MCNIVFLCIDKLFISFDTIDVGDLSVNANKYNSSSETIINSRDIRINNVTGNCFVTMHGIKCGVWGFERQNVVLVGKRAYWVLC
jgi:hypothetical protein